MIVFEAISPHPPIIIPEIGQERIKGSADATVAGMQKMAEIAVAAEPETILIISPHSNIFADAISYLSARRLEGNLQNFGFKNIGSAHDNDLELAETIKSKSEAVNITFIGIGPDIASRHRLNPSLDHGCLVPLYYLEKAGLKAGVRLLVMAYGNLERLEHYRFGRIIRESVEELGRRCVLIASGDMSHRLKNEGPYDFHPDGPRFDAEIRRKLEDRDVEGILELPGELRDNAGECGYNSILIMLGSMDGMEFNSEIYSYEGPYGVGYLAAGFVPGEPADSVLERLQAEELVQIQERRARESSYVRWARMILESFVKKGQRSELPQDLQFLNETRSAAFVSLKKAGELRGCIGTILPAYKNLAEEIAENALSAGLKDPRFPPVRSDELDSLVYSVDLLSVPEPCTREQLDPSKYGVIVTCGTRRGLLLPDLEGVDTVEKQLTIALQKAGITKGQKYDIQRFMVERFK